MDMPLALGVDIGGSHITAALVDLRTRKLLPESWTRESVNSHGDAPCIIAAWSEVIKKASRIAESEVTAIGIGMPGPVDYESGTCFIKDQNKYESLYGLNIKNLLAASLECTADNIRLINDAACFLKGETFGGAAQGFSSVIGLTLGTGLGSSVYKGSVARDADLWNTPFKKSIAEDYLSTRWFIKCYQELSGKVVDGVKQLVKLTESESVVLQLFSEFGAHLAAFLNQFIAEEKPQAVVLGGNITQSFSLFEKSLKSHINPAYRYIPIIKATLGEEAAILGASSLWHQPAVKTV